MLQLIVRAISVGKILVQMARLRPQRIDALPCSFFMATSTLVGIRHLIGHCLSLALGIQQAQLAAVTRPFKMRLLLLFIPHIGQRHPAVLLFQQDACLDQLHPRQLQTALRIAIIPLVKQ